MSYPFLSDALKDLLSIDVWLPVPMFGLFVAIAALVAFWVFRTEVERLEAGGTLKVPFSHLIGEFAFVTMICGMLGARVFSILEDPHEFLNDPFGVIFSRGGFAIFGGLIFGTLAGIGFLKRKRFPILPMADAAAPAMILGYAIGRIGCQISGDADWGIPANMALKPEWLPQWLWAQTYDHNIAGAFIPAPGVYPTPIYESFLALVIFGILWKLRDHKFSAGWLFSLYLLLSGLERFLIEKIRVNVKYSAYGFQFTQAELIATTLFALGLVGLIYFLKRSRQARIVAAATFTLLATAACSQVQYFVN